MKVFYHKPAENFTIRIQAVDLARSASILSVMASHFGNAKLSLPIKNEVINYFYSTLQRLDGVSIFFVISGFLITRLIAARSGNLFEPDLKNFYSRRFGRIFPLLVLVCLIGVIAIRFFDSTASSYAFCFKNPDNNYGLGLWASIFTFSLNWYRVMVEWTHRMSPESFHLGNHFDVLWSLAIEEQFYGHL
jgi:peptidoglycan/LPS O-acetylase OafA/YrhL